MKSSEDEEIPVGFDHPTDFRQPLVAEVKKIILLELIPRLLHRHVFGEGPGQALLFAHIVRGIHYTVVEARAGEFLE